MDRYRIRYTVMIVIVIMVVGNRAKEANKWPSFIEPICSVGQVYQGLKDSVSTNIL